MVKYCGTVALALALANCLGLIISPANVQKSEDNAVASAEDAFGTTVGRESLGIYDSRDVRGFSPNRAGNIRINGMYYDQQGFLTGRILYYSTIKIGPASQGYAFPAPTGIVDYILRDSGSELLISPTLSVGPFGSFGGQIDAQIPISGKELSMAVGGAYYRDKYANGAGDSSISYGFVPRWRPDPRIEVVGFYGQSFSLGQTAQGIYIADPGILPGRIERGRFTGPDWTSAESTASNGGLIAKGNFGPWTIGLSGFRSLFYFEPAITNLIFVAEDDSAFRSVVAAPDQRFASTSGEARVSREFSEGDRKHLITMSVRNRNVKATYGGEDFVDLGPGELNTPIAAPLPDFEYGSLIDDRVKQFTVGASYSLNWKDIGEITLGLQRSRYTKSVLTPGLPVDQRTTNVWLPSVSAAAPITSNFSVYGSYVKGLEDAGSASGFADNANQVLPANRTRQWDAGVRWALDKNSTLIVGYFDVEKPYFALDQNNVFGALGSEAHRGVEVSLISNPVEGLSIVGGAVFSRPRVSNPSTIAEPVGERPVGQSDVKVQLNVDYTLPFLNGVSVDGSVNYKSSLAGTVDNAVIIPGHATLNLGARYKFKIGEAPATLRFEVSNVTNVYSYDTFGGGVYAPIDQRGASLYLSADF